MFRILTLVVGPGDRPIRDYNDYESAESKHNRDLRQETNRRYKDA